MNEAHRSFKKSEKGVALIVVILTLSFLLTVGVVLLTVTATGPQVAGNIRTQQQAFNAAEAGFDATWLTIEDYFLNLVWTSFENHYLKDPTGIDLPISNNYFRKLTDAEILDYIDPDGDGTSNLPNVLFCKQPYYRDDKGILDTRYTYTAFLIDDEAGGGAPEPGDAILVCIGSLTFGSAVITSRLEIELAVELPGASY